MYDLGQAVGRKFDETRKYQYTRLVLYLRQLDHQNNLIIKVKATNFRRLSLYKNKMLGTSIMVGKKASLDGATYILLGTKTGLSN